LIENYTIIYRLKKSRLPPLNALRAFEATARLLTLSAAAAELNVTPSAISHQIKTLEESLGVLLFRRANRSLILTADGRALLPGLSDAFRRIAAAVRELETNQRQGVLTVSMLETLAMHWFMPRLSKFQAAHRDIEVRISTTTRMVDFEREDIDLAIRHGAGDWPGLAADFLFPLEILPVCSPGLATAAAPLKTPADLARHILLHATARAGDWPDWLNSAGVGGLVAARALTFEKTNFALVAAMKGIGVAITDRHIVTDDLESGRLIAPFDHVLGLDTGYYLAYPVERETHPKTRLFRDWLLREVAET
jgi:LysR family glycine cleavage system transcriptional activator